MKPKTILILIFLLSFIIVGCKNDSLPSKHYENSNVALNDYLEFLKSVSSSKDKKTSSLISYTLKFKALDDSVFQAIKRDTLKHTPSLNASKYWSIRDSIHNEFLRIVDLKKRDLSDYYNFMEEISRTKRDSVSSELISLISSLQESMDSLKVLNLNAKESIIFYQDCLLLSLKKGFSSKDDVISFLLREDLAFRSFLKNLSFLGQEDLSQIRDSTLKAISLIIDSSLNKDNSFTKDEISLLLTFRSNRRLIQNAIYAINDIKFNALKKDDSFQMGAYSWMILQPWISLNTSSFDILTLKQKKELEILSKESIDIINSLGNHILPIDINNLPQMLFNVALSNL